MNSACEKVYSSRCLFYFQCSTVNIYKYKGKYLLRRIPRASHGSFNRFVISNKHAHMLNGSIPARTKETDKCHRHQRTATGTNDRRKHFMNYCLTQSGKFSFAVDSFLELDYAILNDFIRHIARNEFFEVSHQAFYLVRKFICFRNWYGSHSRTSVGLFKVSVYTKFHHFSKKLFFAISDRSYWNLSFQKKNPVKKDWSYAKLLAKNVSYHKLSLSDSCQHVLMRSKFPLKDQVTDVVLCDFHTFAFVF